MKKVCLALGLLAAGMLSFPAQAVVDETTPAVATVLLVDREGKEVGGAMLLETTKGILFEMNVSGLEPGERAFHIHETGSCVPPKFESAGGHFNPDQKEHGVLNPEGPHLGDMDNLVVAWDGTAHVVRFLPDMQLVNGAESLLASGGASLVIHDDADDYEDDPDGNSGERIACGVIEIIDVTEETE